MNIKIPIILILIIIVILVALFLYPVRTETGETDIVFDLQSTGATVEVQGTINQPFFSVPGQSLKVNGVDVQLFEYPSNGAMENQAALVSPDGSSVGTSIMAWIGTPHFFKTKNAIAIYVGSDQPTVEILEGVFGPQFAGG